METLDQIDPLGANQKNFRPGEAAAQASEIIRQMREMNINAAAATGGVSTTDMQQDQQVRDALANSEPFVEFSDEVKKDLEFDIEVLDAQHDLAGGLLPPHMQPTLRPDMQPTLRPDIKQYHQQDFNPLVDRVSPWQLPTPAYKCARGGKSAAAIFNSATDRFEKLWHCTIQEALPPDARDKTWYSLAICARLKILASATKGQRDEAWALLEQARQKRITASGELVPKYVRTYPTEDGDQHAPTYVERFIWESWFGTTLADVSAALKACTNKDKEDIDGERKQAQRAGMVYETRKQRNRRKKEEARLAACAGVTLSRLSTRPAKRAATTRAEQVIFKNIPVDTTATVQPAEMDAVQPQDQSESSEMAAVLDSMEPELVTRKERRSRHMLDNEMSKMLRACNVRGGRSRHTKKRQHEMQQRAMRTTPSALPAERLGFNALPSLSESFTRAGPSPQLGVASADGCEGLLEIS